MKKLLKEILDTLKAILLELQKTTTKGADDGDSPKDPPPDGP